MSEIDACYCGLLLAISSRFKKVKYFPLVDFLSRNYCGTFNVPFQVPFLDLTCIFLAQVPTCPLLLTIVFSFDTGSWVLISSSSDSLLLNGWLCSLPSCPIVSFSLSSRMVASLVPEVSTVSILVVLTFRIIYIIVISVCSSGQQPHLVGELLRNADAQVSEQTYCLSGGGAQQSVF